MAELIGLTGQSGAGKTKAFQTLIQAAENAGLSIFGFYSPAIFSDKEKTGMEVSLLPNKKTNILGTLQKQANWLQVGRWWMDPKVFELVKEHVKTFTGSDLLLIDEIGPAEINEQKGWPEALELLKDDRYRLGVVSFRPAFIGFFKHHYPNIMIINLDEDGLNSWNSLMQHFCKPSS